jgi:hypothetical protein
MSSGMLRIAVSVALVSAVVGCAAEATDERDEERALEDDVGVVASALVPAVTVTRSEGCPTEPTAAVNTSGTRVTFRMQSASSQSSTFGAVSGGIPDAPYPEKAECTLVVNLSSDQGYQYRLTSLQHQLAYRMPAKGKIRHVSVYKLGDTAEKSKETLVEKGPTNVMTTVTHEGPTEWSACGLKYKLKATAKLVTKGPQATLDDPSTITLLVEPQIFGAIETQTCVLPQ